MKDESRGRCSAIGCNKLTTYKVLEKETGKFLWVCLTHAYEVNKKILLEGKKQEEQYENYQLHKQKP